MLRKILLGIFATIVTFNSFFGAFSITPKGYIELLNGFAKTNGTVDLLYVIDNPILSGEEIAKVAITVPSGFNVDSSSYSISVVGTGAANAVKNPISGNVEVNFSTYLKSGSKAFVMIKNVSTPSVAGSYVFTAKAFLLGDTAGTDLVSDAGYSQSLTINNGGFKTAPWGRAEVLQSGTMAANTGVKLTAVASTVFSYYLYNPIDSGDTISEAIVTLPPEFVTVAATSNFIEVIGTGVGSAPPLGAIAAGLNKKVFVTFSTPLGQGSMAVIKISNVTAPTAAGGGSYNWSCLVMGTSGEYKAVVDSPDFSGSAHRTLISGTAVANVFYGGVITGCDTSKPVTFNVTGSTNSEFRIQLFRTTFISNRTYIYPPDGFDITNATVLLYSNGLATTTATAVSNLTNCIYLVNAVGVANNSPMIVIKNVKTPNTAGNYNWLITNAVPALGTATALAVGQTAYSLTTTIIDKFISGANSTVIQSGGTLYTGSNATYMVKINSVDGDAMKTAFITIPSGYGTVTAGDVYCPNSAGSGTVTITTQPTDASNGLATVNFTSPVGIGGGAFVTLSAVNPTNAGYYIWSTRVAGNFGTTNIAAGASIISISLPTATTTVSAGTTAINASLGGLALSEDSNVTVIFSAGSVASSGNVTISKVLQPKSTVGQPNLIPVGSSYEINSTCGTIVKKLTITIKYTDADVSGKVLNNLVLCYYDTDTGKWKVAEDNVVDKVNKTVSAKTFHFSEWGIFEYQASTETLISGVNIYPSPMTGDRLNLKYVLSSPATVKIEILDLAGKVVKSLINDSRNTGIQSEVWDGNDGYNSFIGNGVYFVRITVTAGTQIERRIIKFAVIK